MLDTWPTLSPGILTQHTTTLCELGWSKYLQCFAINYFSVSFKLQTCRSCVASVTSTKSSSVRRRSNTMEMLVGWLFHFKQYCLWSSMVEKFLSENIKYCTTGCYSNRSHNDPCLGWTEQGPWTSETREGTGWGDFCDPLSTFPISRDHTGWYRPRPCHSGHW